LDQGKAHARKLTHSSSPHETEIFHLLTPVGRVPSRAVAEFQDSSFKFQARPGASNLNLKTSNSDTARQSLAPPLNHSHGGASVLTSRCRVPRFKFQVSRPAKLESENFQLPAPRPASPLKLGASIFPLIPGATLFPRLH
jgi:hypothetical protein